MCHGLFSQGKNQKKWPPAREVSELLRRIQRGDGACPVPGGDPVCNSKSRRCLSSTDHRAEVLPHLPPFLSQNSVCVLFCDCRWKRLDPAPAALCRWGTAVSAQREEAGPVLLPVPLCPSVVLMTPRLFPDAFFLCRASTVLGCLQDLRAVLALFCRVKAAAMAVGDLLRQDICSQCHPLSLPRESTGDPKIQRACKPGKRLAVLAPSLQTAASPSWML